MVALRSTSIAFITNLLLMLVSVSASLAHPDTTRTVNYLGIWREGLDSCTVLNGMDWDAFHAKVLELAPMSLRVIDIETYEEEGVRKYLGVWRTGTGGYGLWHDLSWSELLAKANDLAQINYHLVDVETYMDGDKRKYAAIWNYNEGSYALWSGLEWHEFQAKAADLAQISFYLVDIETYGEGNVQKYTGVWHSGTGGYGLLSDLDWETLQERQHDLALINLRLEDVETYVERGRRKFVGLWRYGSDSCALLGDLDWDHFNARWQDLSPTHCLVDIERYQGTVDECFPTPAWGLTYRESLVPHAMGYAWAALKDGEVIDQGSYGYARSPLEPVAAAVPFTTSTIMTLASVSKTITAAALLSLLQHDLSRLNDRFYPYVQDSVPVAGAGVDTVTLRNLLAHKSGMQEQWTLDGNYWEVMRNWIAQPLVRPPGMKYHYFNSNYSILQAVIEKISGMSYVDYVQQHVLNPMGITGMIPAPPSSTPTLYYGRDDPNRQGFLFGAATMTAAAGWNGSVEHLAKFLRGIRKNTVLGEAATAAMFDDSLGWEKYVSYYGPHFHKNGAFGVGPPDQGLLAGISHFPAGYDAVLLINTLGFDERLLLQNAFEYFGPVVSVARQEGNLPGGVRLEGNYPNPFNAVTRIVFCVGGNKDLGLGASEVRLVVYDLLGREVAVLVNGRRMPGRYEVSFGGDRLASGVYFYRLTAGSHVESRKMVLVR